MDLKHTIDIIASILGVIIALLTIYEKLSKDTGGVLPKDVVDELSNWMFFTIMVYSFLGLWWLVEFLFSNEAEAIFTQITNKEMLSIIAAVLPWILLLAQLASSEKKTLQSTLILSSLTAVISYLAYVYPFYVIIAAAAIAFFFLLSVFVD